MLFVCGAVRRLVLNRKLRDAESIMEKLAREFSHVMNLQRCVLIFDDTPRNVLEDKFIVCSARPSVHTSDEVLITWAKERSKESAVNDVYVTSDRALRNEIAQTGANLLGPKAFLLFALKTLRPTSASSDLDTILEEWLSANVEEVAQEMNTQLSIF